MLLASASSAVVALSLAAAPAQAQLAALRAAAGTAVPPTVGVVASGSPARSMTMQEGLARQTAMQSRAAVVAAYASSAHGAALAALRGGVTDGISDAGLNPIADVRAATLYVAAAAAATTVANPAPTTVAAATDPTGLNTWAGARAPVQTTATDGKVTVRIDQTQQRALLTWQNFDVGANTALVFNQKDAAGTAQPSWTVVNRVANATSPSQVLGSIKADGTVLILNSAGVLFGPGSQVNLHSLIASSLELGNFASGIVPVSSTITNFVLASIKDRNTAFLQNGLLVQGINGYKPQILSAALPAGGYDINKPLPPTAEGGVYVYSGAAITADAGGIIALAAPEVVNAGTLSATDGQVSLQGGRFIGATPSTGAIGSADVNVRGLILASQVPSLPSAPQAPTRDQGIVVNYGVIRSRRGYISLGTAPFGTVTNVGLLQATTSVSRNGKIALTGGTITLAGADTEEAASGIVIVPDDSGETIPQGTPDSPPSFKTSQITIGDAIASYLYSDDVNNIALLPSVVHIDHNAFIYAPSANLVIGHDAATGNFDPSRVIAAGVTIADGATIDVAGIKAVALDASINSVRISPAKRNELRDTPNYREVTTDGSFTLNGATLLVDARVSGVRADGVAYVGSPLLEAGSAVSQIPVSAATLMTKGGTISIDVGAVTTSTNLSPSAVPAITIAKGVLFDISGGWVTYGAGTIRTSELITSDGRTVNIAKADPNDSFVGVVNGFTATQPKFGLSDTYKNAVLEGQKDVPAYDEGRDAGALQIVGTNITFAATLHADAFAGASQRASAIAPTASSPLAGDLRRLQFSKYQLPSGGLLRIGSFSGTSGVGLGQDILVAGTVPPGGDPATLALSDATLSAAGLGGLLLQTSGAVTVAGDARLTLADGGALAVDAGRGIRFDGTVTAPGGRIAARTYELSGFVADGASVTTTGLATVGNPFRTDDDIVNSYASTDALPRLFDVIVTGRLSTAGKFVNDALATELPAGSGFIDGGSISLTVAPKVFVPLDGTTTRGGDLSGSIRLAAGASIDVSAGAYVSNARTFKLAAAGGNVSLIDQTTYATVAALQGPVGGAPGPEAGQTVGFTPVAQTSTTNSVFPSLVVVEQRSGVTIADGVLRGFGFGGGGRFTLVAPDVAIGTGGDAAATRLPLDFLARTGFGALDVTSYHARTVAGVFDNGGGPSNFFDTTTVTIGAGETLDLTQTPLSNVLTSDQQHALLTLPSGGDVGAIIVPVIAVSDYYRRPASLTLRGLTELDVAAGGTITGAAQASITAPKLLNAGTITLAGGTIDAVAALPEALNGSGVGVTASLSEVFGAADSAGHYAAGALNAAGLRDAKGVLLTNNQLFTTPGSERFLYFIGQLGANEGIRLVAGSRTDLAGVAIRNPDAPLKAGGGQYVFGRLIAGGTLATAAPLNPSSVTQALFANPAYGITPYPDPTNTSPPRPPLLAQIAPRTLTAAPGAAIDISGTSATFDVATTASDYAPSLQWSDAGTLALRAGGGVSGASISARGGAPTATGGTLEWFTPTILATDDGRSGTNVAFADQIARSGFATLIADGGLTLDGAFNLVLGKALIARSAASLDGSLIGPNAAVTIAAAAHTDATITAPRIVFASRSGTAPTSGIATGDAAVTFAAGVSGIDFFGGVLFDSSIARTYLTSAADVRLSGVDDRIVSSGAAALNGSLVAAGDLTFDAGRVYTTTGTGNLQRVLENAALGVATQPAPYLLAALGASTITFLGNHIDDRAPLSAGSNLEIRADNVVQNGFLAAPLGRIAFGTAAHPLNGLQFGTSSVTLVSGAGLNVPYGTTTDLTQLFFAPGVSAPLTRLPNASLEMTANTINLSAGGRIKGAGGGDVFAFEFVSGTGGSRDVLSRLNTDAFSSNGYNAATGVGFQFADRRQVYALVPTATARNITLVDPVYSADYGAGSPADLYATSGGLAVTLDTGGGFTGGQYTLLPAHYALLPGAYRLVENTGAVAPAAGASQVLRDGGIVLGGVYSTAGTDLATSQRRSFTLEAASTFLKYSTIKTTSDTATITTIFQGAGQSLPRLPLDAARVVLDPLKALNIAGSFDTAPASGGRGAEVDILGQQIVVTRSFAIAAEGLLVTNATLANLNANSLLIGGRRTENSNDTTALDITATSIAVESGAVINVPEVILAVAGSASRLNVRNGATITASGTLADSRAGDYLIASSTTPAGSDRASVGSVLRLSNGGQRTVTRIGPSAAGNVAPPSALNVLGGTLTGGSLLLDTSYQFTVADAATLAVPSIAISAANVGFGTGTTIDAKLAAELAAASDVSLRSTRTIGVEPGSTLSFRTLALDAPGLAFTRAPVEGEGVTITAGATRIANNGATTATGCTVGVATACTTSGHALVLDTASLTLGSGNFGLAPFDASVTIAATGGVYVEGRGTLQAGPATLTITTPFIADRAAILDPTKTGRIVSDTAAATSNYTIPVIPDYGFVTSGAVTLASVGPVATPGGVRAPGARIAFGSRIAPVASLAIDGVALSATAGIIDVEARGDITVTGAASLATPGFTRSYSDSASTTTVSAGGGTVNLVSLAGGIAIGPRASLTVDSGVGSAGRLNLIASNGAIAADGTLGGTATGTRDASLTWDAGTSAFDLDAFARRYGTAFAGDVVIRAGAGDLTLAAGHAWRAHAIDLTADGGAIAIAGTLDTSGVAVAGLTSAQVDSARVSGGNVALWGRDGVTLAAGAIIDTHTAGYADGDRRQASAGNVTLGIGDTGGAITIAAGATIDLGARRTDAARAAGQSGNRLIAQTVKDPNTLVDKTVYQFVTADTGGTLSLRAPVTGPDGHLVNIGLHGTVVGAAVEQVEAYKTFDLRGLQAAGYDGLFGNATTLYLDPTPTGFNILSDTFVDTDGTQSLPYFVRNFAVTAADGSSLAGVRLRPGLDLVNTGNLILFTPWNFAAGTLDTARASADGLLTPLPQLGFNPTSGVPYFAITPGNEGRIVENYVDFLYRVGGKASGEAPVVSFLTTGKLDVASSISDGFFTFADKSDPNYINYQLGGGDRVVNQALQVNCGTGADCGSVATFTDVAAKTVTAAPDNTLTINVNKLLTGFSRTPANVLAPYNAEANSVSALGNNIDPISGNPGGDPLGFAQLFPRLSDGSAVHSSSLRLVAGRAATGSTDPLRVDRARPADVVVEGETAYGFTAAAGGISAGNTLDLRLAGNLFALDGLIDTTITTAAALTGDSFTAINWGGQPTAFTSDLRAAAKAFFTGGDALFTTNTRGVVTGVAAPLTQVLAFVKAITPTFLAKVGRASGYPPPAVLAGPRIINFGTRAAYVRTLVRTGDGAIDVAASGDVDLRNGATAIFRNDNNTTVSARSGQQVGGTAIYTAGVRVASAPVTATIAGTVTQVALAPNSAFTAFPVQDINFLPSPKAFDDQAAVLASGGGAVSVNAGGSLLARRDLWSETYLGKGSSYAGPNNVASFNSSAVGDAAQRWRIGSIGQDTEIRIAPKYFTSGIGALAGGDVRLVTGGEVRDLTLALDSATTTTTSAAGAVAMTLGRGDLTARVGGDLQAGQIDVASGTGRITVGGSVVGFGIEPQTNNATQYLRVRLAQGNFDLSARGSIAMAGVSALGASRSGNDLDQYAATGFFAPGASFRATAAGDLAYVNNRVDQRVSFKAGPVGGSVLPPSFALTALTGTLARTSLPLLLYPSRTGNLELYSAGDIRGLVIAVSDSDPSLLPGQFSAANASLADVSLGLGTVTADVGLGFGIPGAGPTTTDRLLRLYHNEATTHAGDAAPILIHAGNDLAASLINVPKAALISAGRDVVDLFFAGQNANASDTTIVSAGRDIVATTASSATASLPYIVSGDYVLGGRGNFVVEAGRNLGPFINSAVVKNVSYAGGIQTTGNLYNPWLASGGADLTVLFGIANGVNYTALRERYLNPANFAKLDAALFVENADSLGIKRPDRTKPVYAPILARWLRTNAPADFATIFDATLYPDTAAGNVALGTAAYDASTKLYTAFAALDPLRQNRFLINTLLFGELQQPALPDGPSYLQYVRGYRAIDALFPATAGYTDNLAPYTVDAGTVSADHPQGVPTRNIVNGQPQVAATVATGNADLRLATLQTADGGDLTVVGPGGNFIAGSVVRTSTQAAGRVTRFGVADGASLPFGQLTNANIEKISAIPIGFEGLLTLNGGAIRGLTDGNFLVNQSRIFTQAGGDITLFSSNGDLNAGQGPRSASNFPPVTVKFDPDGFALVDSAGSVSGAGIGAFQRRPTDPASSIILVAPVGLVDAGDAGVRATGNVLVAAARVANADAFSAGGTISGVPSGTAAPVAANPAASSSALAAANASTQAANNNSDRRSVISVDVLGYVGGTRLCKDGDTSEDCRKSPGGQ